MASEVANEVPHNLPEWSLVGYVIPLMKLHCIALLCRTVIPILFVIVALYPLMETLSLVS